MSCGEGNEMVEGFVIEGICDKGVELVRIEGGSGERKKRGGVC